MLEAVDQLYTVGANCPFRKEGLPRDRN